MTLGLEREIANQTVYDRNRQRLADSGVVLPRIADLADPLGQLAEKVADLVEPIPIRRMRETCSGYTGTTMPTAEASRLCRSTSSYHRI